MNISDTVLVTDNGKASLRTRAGAEVDSRSFAPDSDKSVVEVQGWVKAVMRQRGKIVPGSHREGHNIWTNTGREFLAMLMSIQMSPSTPFRNDRVAYIGVGTGSQTEDAGVTRLVTPVQYVAGMFLADLDIPPTFPLTPSRTTVQFQRIFSEGEITTVPGVRVDVSELGLFTNGDPTAVPPYSPGSRDRTVGQATLQAPVAYKTFEPLGKTDSFELEVTWQIRF